MISFVMFFLSTLNTTRLEENVNEHNPSIINLKNRNYLDETMYLDQKDYQSIKNQYGISQNIDKDIELFDYYQNINQNERLLDVESTNNEEKEINHNENNSTNDNISNLLCGDNRSYENHETNYYENQFIRDIEESLVNAYIWDPEIHYEQNFMPSEFNYNVEEDSSMTYDEKMIQEHSGDDHALLQANWNEITISRNISSGRQIEDQSTHLTINPKTRNETKKNLHLKSISDINTQLYHDIDDRKSIWISDINLDDRNLTEIPELIAYKEYLEILSIQNNFISSINENIAGFTCLKKLNLSHNRINSINYKIKNTNLEWVDLSYNCLTYSSTVYIFAITTLKYLNLENNVIEFIEWFNSQELIILNMKNNLITDIPESIAELKFLKRLNLSHNKINNIECKMENTKLEWFDLSHNCLNYKNGKCIFSMTTLKYLNLENNVIEFIGKINSMGLIILNMKKNLISSIPESTEKVTCLKVLNLSRNIINSIKCKMENTNLEWLDLSYNCLTYAICKCIFLMTTPKYLNLETNVIGFMGKINSMGLIILNMKNNLISTIPGSIVELICLKKLNLSHNRINKINSKIKNINLEWFDLGYNRLTYEICKSIFAMKTLKYLNLQNNLIGRIRRFNSTGLIILNISTNPIIEILDSFYELLNIRQLFMSNLKTKKPICFSKVLPNLKVLDISHNPFNFSLDNIKILYLLDEVNLSNCELTNCPISSEMINIRKLILFKNNLQALPIDFGKLSNNIEILDLRENPLIIFSTEDSFGALDILACYYGKVLMDEYIIQNIQALSFDEISFKKYKKEWVYFTKVRKNQINDEFCQNIARLIAYTGGEEIKKGANEVITLVKEIRDSGFIDFEKTIEEVIKIIKENQYENICIKNILDYLNTKFSSKFYKFLDGILYSYKIQCLKSTLNRIYNSDEHLNYWIYHLSDILSFIGIVEVKKNSKIHNDKNIILNCFIDITDLNVLVNIITLELEKDEEMIGIFNILLSNDKEQSRKRLLDGTLKKETTVEKNCVKYILKIYQIIDEFQ